MGIYGGPAPRVSHTPTHGDAVRVPPQGGSGTAPAVLRALNCPQCAAPVRRGATTCAYCGVGLLESGVVPVRSAPLRSAPDPRGAPLDRCLK
jgi:hypothetical protein